MKGIITNTLLGVSGVLLTTLVVGSAFGLHLNFTDSAPTGVWRTSPFTPADLRHGQMVAICPKQDALTAAMAAGGHLPVGSCPNGLAPLLKPLVAVPGDVVTVGDDGVTVNGHYLANSKPARGQLQSANGTPVMLQRYGVEHGQRVSFDVLADEVWIVSSYSGDSFDSRYFGPVPSSHIQGIVFPVVTRGDVAAVYREVRND